MCGETDLAARSGNITNPRLFILQPFACVDSWSTQYAASATKERYTTGVIVGNMQHHYVQYATVNLRG